MVTSLEAALSHMTSDSAVYCDFKSRKSVEVWVTSLYSHPKTYYAVSGSVSDGVYVTREEERAQLTSDSTEYEEFDSREEAVESIKERKFFEVKFTNGLKIVIPGMRS